MRWLELAFCWKSNCHRSRFFVWSSCVCIIASFFFCFGRDFSTLDVKMQDFMSKSARIRYVRYADDIAFAMLEGANSEMVSQGFKQFFNEALTELKLEATSLELVRGISKPCSTLILGVLISIRPDRNLELRAPGSKKKCFNQSTTT